MHHRQKTQAYQQASQTVSKTRQIVMLYDGVIRFLSQAREAIEQRRFEERFHLLTRCTTIITGLQSSLDFEHSPQIAHTLFDYYTAIEARMLRLHQSNSLEECDALIADLKQMRTIWHDIDLQGNLEEAASQPHQEAASGLVQESQPQDGEAVARMPDAQAYGAASVGELGHTQPAVISPDALTQYHAGNGSHYRSSAVLVSA